MIRTVRGNATYSCFKELRKAPIEAIDAGAERSVGRRIFLAYLWECFVLQADMEPSISVAG